MNFDRRIVIFGVRIKDLKELRNEYAGIDNFKMFFDKRKEGENLVYI